MNSDHRFKKFWAEWQVVVYWGLAVTAMIAGAFALAPHLRAWLSEAGNKANVAVVVMLLFLVAGFTLLLTFFLAFKDVDADKSKLNKIIIYCYAFIVFALSSSIVPFVFFPYVPALKEVMETSPIGILKGCSAQPLGAKDDFVPGELRCEQKTNQWVINLGGIPFQGSDNTAAAQLPAGAVPAAPAARQEQLSYIQGGLVIPLYVVVLALMGASVSMTRRVPEFQRRMTIGDPEYVTYDQAREAMVFQIMQVASAPLIAMTAYYIVNPGERASTIVLAFASGFSSETILLFIRAFLEKLKPEPRSTATARLAQPHVQIIPVRLDFGEVIVSKTSSKHIVIENPSPIQLEVTGIVCSGADFSVDQLAPQTIKAGASLDVPISFTPMTSGSKLAVLTVTDNAPGSPRSIHITGTGIDAPPTLPT